MCYIENKSISGKVCLENRSDGGTAVTFLVPIPCSHPLEAWKTYLMSLNMKCSLLYYIKASVVCFHTRNF